MTDFQVIRERLASNKLLAPLLRRIKPSWYWTAAEVEEIEREATELWDYFGEEEGKR